jgi:hypothetical protein
MGARRSGWLSWELEEVSCCDGKGIENGKRREEGDEKGIEKGKKIEGAKEKEGR